MTDGSRNPVAGEGSPGFRATASTANNAMPALDQGIRGCFCPGVRVSRLQLIGGFEFMSAHIVMHSDSREAVPLLTT